MSKIIIRYDSESVTVYTDYEHKYLPSESEIAFADKHTRMEDIAQGFYELAAALNANVTLEKI